MDPLPDPVAPTTETIARVKTNLKRLETFNNTFYSYTTPYIVNVFARLSAAVNNDPGMNIGLNLLCGGIIGVGGEFSILGCVIANYLCGMIAEYSDTKPPSLLLQFDSYLMRVQQTSLQANNTIEEDYSNPEKNWYTVKSGTFATPWGSKTLGCCLGQLATVDVPEDTDPLFGDMMTKAMFSFDQTLWWTVLNSRYQINGWNTGWMLPPIVQASDVPNGDAGMNNCMNNLMLSEPAYWNFWVYDHSTDKKGRDTSVYIVYEYSLGIEPTKTYNRDQPISNDAANYLFIDTIPGNIVNPQGLFERYYVFNNFGLKKIEQP